MIDKRGGRNAEFDKELAETLKSELKRITMGTTAPMTKWETVSFHALQYCAKSFEKVRGDEERSDSIIPPFCITNNLPLVASLLATLAHRSSWCLESTSS